MEKPKLFVPVMGIGAIAYTMREVPEYEEVHMIGYEEYQFVIHQHVDIGDNNDEESWVVTEVSTGAKVAENKLKAVVLKHAQANLSSVTKERFAEMIAEAKIQSDLARERTIVYKIHDQVASKKGKHVMVHVNGNQDNQIMAFLDENNQLWEYWTPDECSKYGYGWYKPSDREITSFEIIRGCNAMDF